MFHSLYTSSPSALNQNGCFGTAGFAEKLGVTAVAAPRCQMQFLRKLRERALGILVIATQTRFLQVPIEFVHAWLELRNPRGHD